MKKLSALAITLAISSSTFADHNADHELYDWVGIFATHYSADDSKPNYMANFDDGNSLGGEAGFRFTSEWAARIEAAYLDIDGDGIADESGMMYGADALYFLPDDVVYLFAGLKQQHLDTAYRMGNVGVGKHWNVADNIRVITEAAAYYDFGQDFKDYSIKLGLAYYFGGSKASSPVTISQAPSDADQDGIIDVNDRCPATPKGVSVDQTGCPLDSDNDGVADFQDQCPTTPAGDVVDATGCSVVRDSDNDGVTDDIDQCPSTPQGDRVYPENGCTVFEEQEVAITLEVLFGNNSVEIDQPDHPDILEFVAFMKRYGTAQADIEGHTSAAGSASYNLKLSQERAEAVKRLLVEEHGIASSRLNAVGYGETRLLDTSNTAQAHKVNRRITAKVSEKVRVRETK